MWIIGLPPEDVPVWFYGRCLRFTSSLTVRMGKLVLQDGKVCVLDEHGNPADYGTDAILGWAHLRRSFGLQRHARQPCAKTAGSRKFCDHQHLHGDR